MAYHPTKSSTDLPVITCVEDVRTLPWGGNAWWDLPIMAHVEASFVRSDKFSLADRRAACELAGNLMTGEDCEFSSDQEFLDYLAELPA